MSDRELYHYGVKGMRWGVRRFQNKDGSLTPAGKARYQKAYDKEVRKYMNEDGTLTEQGHRKYRESERYDQHVRDKLAKHPEIDERDLRNLSKVRYSLLVDAETVAENKLRKLGVNIYRTYPDPDSGERLKDMKKKTKQTSPEEDCLAADPHKYDKDNVYRDPLPGVMAFELRRRGYDVQAKKTPFLSRDFLFEDEVEIYSQKGLSDLISKLKSQIRSDGKNSRGYIHSACNDDMFQHYVAYEVVNGKLKIYDTTTGKVYNDVLDDPLLALFEPSWIGYKRTDDVDLDKYDTEEYIHWYREAPGYSVESRKGK